MSLNFTNITEGASVYSLFLPLLHSICPVYADNGAFVPFHVSLTEYDVKGLLCSQASF